MSDDSNADSSERPSVDDGGGTDRRTFLKGSAVVGLSAVAGTAPVAAQGTVDNDPGDVPRAVGENGMVSSAHPRATEVGAEVLRNGGNAVDAAVAVQFAINVAQPHSSGIGGGGFMVVYVAEEDEVYTVDNRERAPLGADEEMFLDDGEPIPFEERHTHGRAVGVPGTLRAADVALKRFGTMELSELIDPAIDLARGCDPVLEVDASLAESIAEDADLFNDAAREVFVPDGEPLQEGDPLVQRDLAKAFRRIQEEGIGAFYRGEIAEAIAETVQETGGTMRVEDLARYNVTIDHPEYAEFNDVTVRTQSLPSSGGLTIGQILKLVEPLDLGQYGPNAPETLEALLEAFGLAYADRGAYMGDKAFVDAPWQGLFDDDYLAQRRDLMPIDQSAGGAPEPGDPWSFQPGDPYRINAVGAGDLAEMAGEGGSFRQDRGQTTHFTTADSEGNLVSWTSTIEQFFGTKIMVPGYGIMLNNELTDFDAVPGGPNEAQPDKRPLSSTSPTIVFQDGDPFMTVGSPGGKTIITTVARIIMNVVEFGMSVEEAIAAPRFYKDVDPEVFWESGLPEDTRDRLRQYGFELADEPTQLGNAQAIRVGGDEARYVGVADPRRDGSVIGL